MTTIFSGSSSNSPPATTSYPTSDVPYSTPWPSPSFPSNSETPWATPSFLSNASNYSMEYRPSAYTLSSRAAFASAASSAPPTSHPVTDANGVVHQYLQANGSSYLLTSSALSTVASVESGQTSGADAKSSGFPLPAIVGVVIASIFIIVALIVGRMWVRHRRAKTARQDARVMREIGRGDGGVWSFENQPASAPVTRQALASQAEPQTRREMQRESGSTWSDDSEMDMMATDGSTLARTLSSRSTDSDATIRTLAINTREALNHPGYTYRPAPSRSAPSTAPLGSQSNSPQTLRSPFSDSSSPSSNYSSPFSDPASSPSEYSQNTLPRAESRLSTTSSENPFRDPLPAYTLEEAGRAPPELLSGVPVIGDGGLERALLRPPPAYAERDRAAR